MVGKAMLGALATMTFAMVVHADGFGTLLQPLNHSAPAGGSFKQRFWVNSTFSGGRAGAPVLLIVGGEMSVTEWISIVGGQVFPLAEAHNATIVALEHRGFGLSVLQGGDASDLFALRADQAAEDVAGLRRHAVVSGLSAPDAKWLAFGCSYSGMVAAFSGQLRQSDGSHVLDGVVASSAPLVAQTEFVDYTTNVATAFGDAAAGGSAACASGVSAALAAATGLVSGGASGWERLAGAWGLCAAPGSVSDAQWAWRFAAEYVLGYMVVQESRGYGIPFVCSNVLRPGVAPLEGLGQALSAYAGGSCSDVGTVAGYVAELRNVTAGPADFARQYTWLKCTTLGWLHACGSADGCGVEGSLPLSLLQGLCRDAFGLEPAQQSAGGAALNARFGGTAPPGRSDGRVQYVLGGADPWRALGADAGRGGFVPPVVEVEGGWHCSDMDVVSDRTPGPVLAARAAVAATVARWLR